MLRSLRQVRAVYRRFVTAHLEETGPAQALIHDGRTLGYVDRISYQNHHLRVSGWTLMPRLSLENRCGEVTANPTLLRLDVQDALGVEPQVGFDLTLPSDGGDVALTLLSADGGRYRYDLRHPVSRVARWRVRRRFATAFLRALPALARWSLTRADRHRMRAKEILHLNTAVRKSVLRPEVLGPIDEAHAVTAPPKGPVPPITIILPVYNAFDLLPEVLDRVERHTDLPWHLILIEDCSTDDRVRPFLTSWVAAQRDKGRGVTLLTNPRNLGFIESVNRGLALALQREGHVVLLNSDALVPDGWASRLVAPILADPEVASTTPMSNDAEIFSVPVICTRTVLVPGMADAIDAVARGLQPAARQVPAPTGVGFCMAMNAAFLRRVPALDTTFGRGYGEEVDWCQKVRRLGGRHVAVTSLFVEHRGGESFGTEEKRALVAANNQIVSARYPDYDQSVQDYIAADPLLTERLALALAHVGAGSAAAGGDAPVAIYLAHDLGGGAEIYLENRIRDDLAANGAPAVVLRVGGPMRWQVEVWTEAGRTIGQTDDFDLVTRLLAPIRRRRIVYSCGVGDSDPIGLPDLLLGLARSSEDRVEVLVHDFFPVSPAYTLLDGDGVYRGPVLPGREDKPHGHVHRPRAAQGTATLADWQAAWGRLIARADEVTVFSDSSRQIMSAVFPDARIAVRPPRMPVVIYPVPRPAGPQRVVAVLGGIGFQKGAKVLQDFAATLGRRAEVRLVLIGTIDPAFALPPTVHVHGTYMVEQIPALVQRYAITDWLIPSIWPETFSFATREALGTGLPVYAFDLGAQGEAVRAAPNGHPIPFDPTLRAADLVAAAILPDRVGATGQAAR